MDSNYSAIEITITIPSCPGVRSKHFRRNLYKLLSVLGFELEVRPNEGRPPHIHWEVLKGIKTDFPFVPNDVRMKDYFEFQQAQLFAETDNQFYAKKASTNS